MFVAKQFDIIMGVDTHIILVPTPGGPVPTPIPHPFIGIVFDPPEFVPIIGASILVNGIPRGQAGTKVKNAVPHIPIGGVFQKPPSNEGEIQMGSLTVIADWQPCSFSGLPAYTCQDIGKAAPTRKKRKSSAKTKGLVMPTSILLAIPKGGVNSVGPIGAVPVEQKIIKITIQDLIKKGLLNKKLIKVLKKLPQQIHHLATNKGKHWLGKRMGGIAKKYKLDLDGAWNKVDIPHRGRHTKKYHQFVYKAMKKADEIAKGDQKKFLQEFNKRVRSPVLKNPAILRKIGADYLP